MDTKDVIVGIVMGLAIAWFFGGRQQTQPTQTISSQYISQYMLGRMDRIEQLLTQNQQPLMIQQPAQVVNTGYKNDEKWVIDRGKDGHIRSLQVVRDAKVKRLD